MNKAVERRWESEEDDLLEGAPVTSRDDVNIDRLHMLIISYSCLSISAFSDELVP